MKLLRRIWWIAPLCLTLAVLLFFGGVLAIRGDMRYRLWLRVKPYSTTALQEVTPKTELLSVTTLLTDSRVCENHCLLLINGDHPLPQAISYPLTSERNGYRMQPIVLDAFIALRQSVLEHTGEELLLRSAYRNAEEQHVEWKENGSEIAARVGYSEHETGLALDVCVVGYGGNSFLKTQAGRFVGERCWEQGFIIRYPLGKENVTGFLYEPWHLRYVGMPHAEIMMESNLTMEEYLEALTPDTWYQNGTYYILRTAQETVPVPVGFDFCEVSLDNLGYRVFTYQMDG